MGSNTVAQEPRARGTTVRKSNFVVGIITIACGCAVVVACSSTSVGSGASGCSNDYSGRWKLSGTCTNTSCDLTQSACSLTVRCDDGSQGNGTVTCA